LTVSLIDEDDDHVDDNKQVAQLSQRDRAAGWVSIIAKGGRLELETIFYGHYESI